MRLPLVFYRQLYLLHLTNWVVCSRQGPCGPPHWSDSYLYWLLAVHHPSQSEAPHDLNQFFADSTTLLPHLLGPSSLESRYTSTAALHSHELSHQAPGLKTHRDFHLLRFVSQDVCVSVQTLETSPRVCCFHRGSAGASPMTLSPRHFLSSTGLHFSSGCGHHSS